MFHADRLAAHQKEMPVSQQNQFPPPPAQPYEQAPHG